MALKPRILIIDDDDGFRALVSRSLRDDYIIFPASDGEQALESALELCPDIILLDMGMPRWDGKKTLQEFRKETALDHVPVMALTGDNRVDTVRSIMAAGASGYVLKDTFHDDRDGFIEKLELILQEFALPETIAHSLAD